MAQLKINGDLLSSDYSTDYAAARNAWNSSAKVSATQASFSASNITLGTATPSLWDDLFGNFKYQYYGFSVMQDLQMGIF